MGYIIILVKLRHYKHHNVVLDIGYTRTLLKIVKHVDINITHMVS